MEEYKLDFEKLAQLCSEKILSKVPKEPGKIKGAFNGGDYLGRPGKDVYFALSYLTKEQMEKIADILSNQFPYVAPNNHVGYAACIRYIYGQFEKQGILRSDEDLRRMEREGVDWNLPRKFMLLLKKKFEEKNNNYALCIYYEMEAHRLGDEGFLHKDENKIKEMEETYLKSVEYAYKCNSLKQKFTPYFWAFKYFAKLEDHKRALKYVIKTLEQMEKFCPSPKQGYLVKAEDCAKYLKNFHREKWKEIYDHYKRHSTNDCIKRMLKGTSA